MRSLQEMHAEALNTASLIILTIAMWSEHLINAPNRVTTLSRIRGTTRTQEDTRGTRLSWPRSRLSGQRAGGGRKPCVPH